MSPRGEGTVALAADLGRGWDDAEGVPATESVAREVAAGALNASGAEAGGLTAAAGWKLAVDRGWHRALVPESQGGSPLDLLQLAPVAEALAVAGAYPAFASTAVDVVCLLRQGSGPEGDAMLRSIATGDARPVFQWPPRTSGAGSQPVRVVVSEDADDRPPIVRCIDGGRPADPGARSLVESLDPAAVESTLALGAALDAAALVGLGRQALALTVQYACERVQFDRPIGTLQAVQHHCVDMFLLIEQARVLTGQALRSLADAPSLTREVMFAKVKASELAIDAMRRAHRIHGGVGYSSGYPLAALTRSALAIRGLHGSAAWHRARLRDLLQASPQFFTRSQFHTGAILDHGESA